MKYIQYLLTILNGISRFKNIFLIIILTRLVFLENDQLSLISEIIGGVVMLISPSCNNILEPTLD